MVLPPSHNAGVYVQGMAVNFAARCCLFGLCLVHVEILLPRQLPGAWAACGRSHTYLLRTHKPPLSRVTRPVVHDMDPPVIMCHATAKSCARIVFVHIWCTSLAMNPGVWTSPCEHFQTPVNRFGQEDRPSGVKHLETEVDEGLQTADNGGWCSACSAGLLRLCLILCHPKISRCAN